MGLLRVLKIKRVHKSLQPQDLLLSLSMRQAWRAAASFMHSCWQCNRSWPFTSPLNGRGKDDGQVMTLLAQLLGEMSRTYTLTFTLLWPFLTVIAGCRPLHLFLYLCISTVEYDSHTKAQIHPSCSHWNPTQG